MQTKDNRFSIVLFAFLTALAFMVLSCSDNQETKPGSANRDAADDGGVSGLEDWSSRSGTDPNRYHWDGRTHPFYEGWFFRVALTDGRSFGFIYTNHNPGARTTDPSGLQLIISRNGGDVVWNVLDGNDFAASRWKFEARFGEFRAEEGHFDGTLYDENQVVSWDIDYDTLENWPDTMGILTDVPGIPINWHVGALRARGHGFIQWGDERISFTDAAVFQDHNWGDYFPEGYIWMQSQEFADPEDALAIAGGAVGPFEAGMFVWRRGGERIEIRSQDLDALFLFSTDDERGEVEVDIRHRGIRYVVTGFFADDIPVILPAPKPEGYIPYTRMALSGLLQVRVFQREGLKWKQVKEVWSENAGVEMGGKYGPPIL